MRSYWGCELACSITFIDSAGEVDGWIDSSLMHR